MNTLPDAPLKRPAVIVIWSIAVFAVYFGWTTFWFLTDDAYIAFRYVSNGMAGYGFVWNPPPFLPVEGYTSFLWVVLLKLVWQITGVEPPVSANYLSLAFGYATLFVCYRFVARMTLPARLSGHRLWILALIFIGTITNRTFLTWLSSGLETALFNFCVTWWLYEAFTAAENRDGKWAFRFSASAALSALARPDGLLVVAGTLVIHCSEFLRKNGNVGLFQRLACSIPLAAVPVHLVWRRLIYGEWLPNTYYCKHTGVWPESGLRYLGCFIIEYGLWIWLLFATAYLVPKLRRHDGNALRPGLASIPPIISAMVLLGHFGYYTLIIGGDHFEYRVFSHLIPLLFLSAAWLISRISERPPVMYAFMLTFILVSYPIPWLHWQDTKDLKTRDETHMLIHPVADHFPAPIRPVIDQWDKWQAWLIMHHVGMRHQEHKIFHEFMTADMPARTEGLQFRWEQRIIMSATCVGVVGWVLPGVAVIDALGLNDRVIARTPVNEPKEQRQMAHDRKPPPGYIECFRPTRFHNGERYLVLPYRIALTDDAIRACESHDWLKLAAISGAE